MRAMDTNTSALISSSVISPAIAPLTIGMPQSIMATHAALAGNDTKSKKLMANEIAERQRNSIVRLSLSLKNVNKYITPYILMGVYVHTHNKSIPL